MLKEFNEIVFQIINNYNFEAIDHKYNLRTDFENKLAPKKRNK